MKFPIIVLLAAGALSAPFDINEFNRWVPSLLGEDECVDPRLKQDVTSIFSYEGETISTVQGSTSDSTGLKLRAKILIHPQGACRFRMQINNPELLVKSKNQQHFQTADQSRKFSRELEAQDLVFRTSRGRITQLFPTVGEAVHILNIKRGILSTLQLQTDATEEVDVNGRCKVNVFRKDGVTYKAKSLSECSERAHNELGIQAATFAHKSPIKPLNSTSTCAYKMEGEKIQSVECLEGHTFRPFSAGYQKPAGAITTVKQVMALIGEKQGGIVDVSVESQSSKQGVSLVYEHESQATKPDNTITERIDKVMSTLVDTSKENNFAAKQSSAHEFTHLVNLMRKLDTKRMTPVMEKYFDCYRSGICSSSDSDIKGVYRQYILDALTYCATPTCFHAVHDVIIKGEVTGELMNMFLQGISLVAKPTKQMIKDLLNIATNKPSRQSFLSLGSMLQRYCNINSAGCASGKWNPVTQAELFLEDKLGNGCEELDDYKRVEEVLMAIKAIGNAGQPIRATKKLLKCARNSRHMNVTTAALESLRHMPCSEDVSTTLHDLHEDMNMDTEKRIQTYLALMRCPTENTITRLIKQLKGEKSNQVGSFMLSHLKNINESSDPRHARTQEILSSIFNPKDFQKFDLPLTRFSKAFEGSLYSKYLKSGVSVDGHVIYNPDNILPRSALFNMTANILDVPVNVIEMAARVEGVETLMEGLFGPYGYFPEDSIMKIFNVTFTKDDIQKLRSRRSAEENVAENIENMHEKVNKKRTQPAGFLSMKVLGHEMRVFSYDDIMWAADEIDNMNVIELLLKIAKGGHKTFTKSVMFLEMTHTVPTGLGFPIKLKLAGSAVASVELDGKFDVRNMFWGPSSLEVKGYVRPSAVVEVSGQMGVHSNFVDTGIFVNTSMFTSQMMKGSVVYKEGQQFRINIDAPEEPIEFFNISSTPYMFVDEEISLIKGAPRRVSPDFCLNSKMVFGLGVCTSMSVPVAFRDYEAPYFPLSGPAHFGMRLVKADPKLTTYQFLVSVSKKQVGSGRELSGSFEIGTPGATYSRRVSGIVKYTETRKVRTLIIGSLEAKNNAELSVSYHNDTNRFEVDFSTNAITNKPIKMKMLYFNDTSFIAKEAGVLVSAQYDWYKFQHVSKFVRKMESGSYLLHTKTTYWPKKHLTGEIEYMPKTKSLTVRMDANQLNQRLVMNGRIISTDSEKGLNFTATTTMANASFYAGIKNTESEKKFIFNTTCMRGLRNEIVFGYYRRLNKQEVRFDVDIAGKAAAMFIDYNNLRSGWHGVNVGASVMKNVIGLASSYNMESTFDQQACIIAFYNEKRPAKTCLVLSEVPSTKQAAAFKRLTWSVEVLKKIVALTFDVKNTDRTYGLTSALLYQSKELAKNVMELTYDSLLESQLKMTSTVGQRSVSTRFFSTKKSNDFTQFGIEALGFNQMLKLQGTYSKSLRADVTVHGVVLEGWVNKKLPISYTFLVEYTKKMTGASSILKIKEYTAKSSLIWIRPEASEYSIVSDVSITKKDLVIFANKMTDIVFLGDIEKAYKFLWEFTIWNKKFKYGYDIKYENQSTESQSAYAVTVGVDYARNKRSSMKTTFSNSNQVMELLMDVKYLPGRQVSHFARYSKFAKQLDVSVEFLPKMFVKLMGRLDQTEGWKFTTDLKFSWANYQKSLQWIASYVKKAELKGLNFKFTAFNQKFFIGSEYNSKTKTVIFTVTAFKRSVRLVTFLLEKKGLAGMKLTTEKLEGNMITPTEIIEAVVQFSKTLLAFELRTSKKSFVKSIAVFDKANGVGSLEFFVLKRNIFKVQADYKKDTMTAVSRMFFLGKERFQIVGKYDKEAKTFLLSFDALKKNWNVMFSAKWTGERKELTVSTEFMKRVIGFSARFDPFNYAAGAHVFYKKNIIGWSMMYNPKTTSFVYNVTMTPRLSAQLVLQVIDDHIISATIQRKFGSEVVNEFVFKYELASATSSLIFEWNKETVQKAKDLVMPVLKNGFRDVSILLTKAIAFGKELGTNVAVKGSAKVLSMINNADKMFDEFDFVAARDRAGQMVLSVLKKSGKMTSDALRMTSKGLMKLHKKMPYIMEQTQKYSREGLAVAKSALDGSYKVAKVAYKMVKNITEAGLPVAKTALKLAKDFKIRGRTTEDIVTDLVKMINKLAVSYKLNLSKQITKMNADIKEYLKNVNVPYSEKKLGELVEEYITKVKTIDFEKKVRELTKKIMEFKVMEKTIKEHLDILMKKAKNLPEDLKKTMVSVIKMTRVNAKKIRKFMSKIETFFQPMTRCLMKMKSSVKKHFGPLVTKGNKMLQAALKKEFNKLYLPTGKYVMMVVTYVREFVLPIVKPIVPLYEDLKNQIRSIVVLEYQIGSLLDKYVGQYKLKMARNFANVKSTMKSYMQHLKMNPSLTAEENVEKIIDDSISASKRSFELMKNIYNERRQMYVKMKARGLTAWKKVSDAVSNFISRPVVDIINEAFLISGKYSKHTMKEVASVLDQLADIDVSTPLSKAWVDMDILNHFENYGVNSRILTAIATAKKVNVTEAIFMVIKDVKTATARAYSRLASAVMYSNDAVNNVFTYIKSIPKKDFEVFYSEVESAVMKIEKKLYKLIKNLVYTAKDKLMAAKLDVAKAYKNYMDKYGKPLKQMYYLVKERSMLVYDEVKDDCVYVKDLYKALVTGMVVEKYEKLQKAMKEMYDELYNKAMAFYKKYENQTWETIGTNAYQFGKNKFEKVYTVANVRLERLRAVTKNAVEMLKKFYEKAMTVAKENKARLEKLFNEKIKPEAMRVYEMTVSYAKTKGDEYYKRMAAAYKKLNAEVVRVYELNKKLSIRQLYVNLKQFTTKTIKEYVSEVKTIAKKNYGAIYTRSMKLKQKFQTEMLPILREEAESIINQTLRASVILANETVKAFRPHFEIAMKYSDRYFKDVKVAGKKYMVDAKQATMDLYKKGVAEAKIKYTKLVDYVKKVMQKIKSHPKYLEIVNHEAYGKIKVFVEKMMKMIKERIAELKTKFEELKNHPKFKEMKTKLKDFMEEPKIKELIKILKQVKESGQFTLMKLKEKVSPLMKKIELATSEYPRIFISKMRECRPYPEECFWSLIAAVKQDLSKIDYSPKALMKTMTESARNFVLEVTDESAMNFMAAAQENVILFYKRAIDLPRLMKLKFTRDYAEALNMMKARWAKLVEQWKQSAVYPIVSHEIWGEIAEEIKNHEMVIEMKELAKKVVKKAIAYNAEVVAKIKAFMKNRKAMLKAEVDRLVEKYNKFLDETTLEKIVTKSMEVYKKIMIQREKIMVKVNEMYAKAKKEFMDYKTKAVEFGNMRFMMAKKMWSEQYPKFMGEMKSAYKKYIMKLDASMKKLNTYYNDFKASLVAKTMKLWDESSLKQRLVTFKGMTVGETVAAIKKIPGDINVKLVDASKMIMSKFDHLVKPYMRTVVSMAKIIGNEINETAVFVYRYYHVKQTTRNVYDRVLKKIQDLIPRVPVFTKTYLKKISKISVKGLHATFVFLDNVDLKAYVAKMKSFVPDFKTFVTIQAENGRITLRIKHPKEIEPKFSYHADKVKGKVVAIANKIANKTISVTRALLDDLKMRTMELRRDLNMSILAHSKLVEHLKAKSVSLKENGLKRSAAMKKRITAIVNDWVKFTKAWIEWGKRCSTAAYAFTATAAVDIADSQSIQEAYEKFQKWVKTSKKEFGLAYTIAKNLPKFIASNVKSTYAEILSKSKPYYLIVKEATEKWRNGAGFRIAFREVELKMKAAFNYAKNELNLFYNRTRKTITKALGSDDVQIVEEYLSTHRNILGKYAKQVYRLYKWNKIRLDRAIRKTKMFLRFMKLHYAMKVNPLRTYAMIFGKSHVMTFDGKYYDFIKYAKPDCTYLLGHDFRNGNFTLLSQKENIILKTPEMNLKIHASGRVSGTITELKSGARKTKVIKDLPIDTEEGYCKMWKKLIFCGFKQGVKLRCDTSHFLCSVELSGWHYGKSQGLLGTNNNEMFDEFKMADNKITTSVTELANSWLVSKDEECKTNQFDNEAPTCNKSPSDRCFEVFKKKTSPFAKYFSTLDTRPFFQACQIDSADCDSKDPAAISHCNATAAYSHMLHLMRIKAPKIADCEPMPVANGKQMKKGDSWTQKPTKEVDVVVMVSGRSKASKFRRSIASMLYSTNKNLMKMGFNTRYALISYGTDSKSSFGSNTHTHAGEYFSNMEDIATAIKTMEYTGEEKDTNDYYAAILRATKLSFRPGAAKLFYLFNFDDYKPAWFGPTLDETKFALKYHANASLFVFSDFNFKSMENGEVFGKTADHVYIKPFRPVKMATQFPVNDFTKLVRHSGAMFLNNLKPSQAKSLTAALSDAARKPLIMNMKTCKVCTVGRHNTMCRSDITVKC